MCLPRLSGSGSQRLGRPLPRCGAPFPSTPSARGRVPAACVCSQELASSQDPPAADVDRPSRILDRNRRPVCRVRGGGFSGAEFAPFPSPLPPTSSRDGPALLWSFSVPLFCEWVNFSALPKCKKAHPTALRAFGPVLTLSNAARASPFHPHLLVAGAGVRSTFLLGVAFRHVICGPYLIFPPS